MSESRKEPGFSIPPPFRLLFDQLADSVVITSPENVILYVNPAFEQLTGYTREEAIGQSPNILRSGFHHNSIYEELQATLRRGETFRYIFRNRKKNGDVYEEGVMLSPLRDEQGKIAYYLAMGREVNGLRQSYEAFSVLANNSPIALYVERNGVIVFANDNLAHLVACSTDELIGKNWLNFLPEEERAAVLQQSEDILAGRLDFPLEHRIAGADGQTRWVMSTVRKVSFRGIRAESGESVVGHVVDITARKLAEERLRNAISLHVATIESTTDGIVVVNAARQVVSHNRRYEELLNCEGILDGDPVEVGRQLMGQLKDPEQLMQSIQRTHLDPTRDDMATVELIDGRYMEVYSKPQIVEDEVVGRVWSWRDVTERRRFESALIHLANYDSLTGLMNRRKIQEELEACLAAANDAHGALLLLDLDRFKEVNDGLGHQAGDEVLVQVARVLADAGVGELIGRFGGDEFAILLPGVTSAEAMHAAERTLNRLAEAAYITAGTRISLTGSMGVAFYPAHATTEDELVGAADLALYEAKSSSRSNLHVYSPRLRRRSRLQRRGDWQTQLRNAISDRRGKLYAEKTVPLHDKAPVIYRLTIRMSGSRGQVLSTRELGALAQQARLSLELDRWLLREAIALARRPAFIAAAAGLAFELSPHSLSHPDILKSLLDLASLRARRDCPLIIEPTDLDSIAGDHGAFNTLRSAGYRFKVAAADSATLARVMQTLPIDYLKLDSTIVGQFAENASVSPLIEGLLHTARRLGAYTVAEGVPNQATLDALRKLGIDYARGAPIDRARSVSTVFKATARKPRAA